MTSERVTQAGATAAKAVNDTVDLFTKGTEQITAFNRESIEAFVKSSNLAIKAAEEVGAELTSYASKTMNEGLNAVKGLGEAKNVLDLIERQSSYARAAFEEQQKQASKLAELLISASKKTSEPLNARGAAFTDFLKKASA